MPRIGLHDKIEQKEALFVYLETKKRRYKSNNIPPAIISEITDNLNRNFHNKRREEEVSSLLKHIYLNKLTEQDFMD